MTPESVNPATKYMGVNDYRREIRWFDTPGERDAFEALTDDEEAE